MIDIFSLLLENGLLTTAFIIGAVSIVLAVIGQVPVATPLPISRPRAIMLGAFGLLLMCFAGAGFFIASTGSEPKPAAAAIAATVTPNVPMVTVIPPTNTWMPPTYTSASAQILPTNTLILPPRVSTPQPLANLPAHKPTDILIPLPPIRTPIQLPVLEKRFTVVYPGRDGVNLRTGPGISHVETAKLSAETELIVKGQPTRSEDDRKWWPVSSQYGEGWVAEYDQVDSQGWRLIKPKLTVGDIVQVANPLCTTSLGVSPGRGRVILNMSSQNRELDWGTRLLITGGPLSTFKNDYDDYKAAGEGRQWWHVRVLEDYDDVRSGEEGWVADFASEHKNILIAPEWYVSLSAPIALPGANQFCP